MSENAENKLSTHQKRSIFFNYCLFLVNTNQFDICKKELEVFKSKFSASNDAAIIESYLYLKEKNEAKAIKVLSDNFPADKKQFNENSDLELILLLVQLHIKSENFAEATKTLEKLGNQMYLPAILSTLYLLYEKANNYKAIEDLFLKAVKWHESNKVRNHKYVLWNKMPNIDKTCRVHHPIWETFTEKRPSFTWTKVSHSKLLNIWKRLLLSRAKIQRSLQCLSMLIRSLMLPKHKS